MDGYVVSRKGEVGAAAGLSDELFQIATDLYAMEVPVDAKAELLKRIVPGQPALVWCSISRARRCREWCARSRTIRRL